MRFEDALAFRDQALMAMARMEEALFGLAAEAPNPAVAIGLTPGRSRTTWRVAVRIVNQRALNAPALAAIETLPRSELDIHVTGPIVTAARPRKRPVRPGCSISGADEGVGTLGAWVETDGKLLALSCNHVLVSSAGLVPGNPVLQPGVSDGGESNEDRVGRLDHAVPLKRSFKRVDASTARIDSRVAPSSLAILEIGRVQGWHVGTAELSRREPVWKMGCRTGLTTGRLAAIGIRNLPIRYDDGRKPL